ncbi:MAG: hypothetical protein QM572_00280 [Nocardioides sp.]
MRRAAADGAGEVGTYDVLAGTATAALLTGPGRIGAGRRRLSA